MTILAELIDYMGNDLRVANAARVSFDKHHEKFIEGSDDKLIGFLAREHHEIPFAHPHATFRITAPIFVRAQAFKHKVGFSESEISRRYVSSTPEFHIPDVWRKKHPSKKQGSMDEPCDDQEAIERLYISSCMTCVETYETLLRVGVCPEQARMVLPQSMITQWYWTSSLLGFARMYNLRSKPDAQLEIRTLAETIGKQLEPLFPVSWRALTGET